MAQHVDQGALRYVQSLPSLVLVMMLIPQSAMFTGAGTPNAQPVLQCVQIKPLVGQQGSTERYRVVFSDIRNFVQSMLATRAFCHQ
jgi:hypothetical protein